MFELDISKQVCVPLRGLLMNCYMHNVTRTEDVVRTASGIYAVQQMTESKRLSNFADYKQHEHLKLYDIKKRSWYSPELGYFEDDDKVSIKVNGRTVGVYHLDLDIIKTQYGFKSNLSFDETIEHQKCISMLLKNVGFSLNCLEIGSNANQIVDDLLR